MAKEPLEVRCMWCGNIISPGQRFAITKQPMPSLRGVVKWIFCERCGEEREERMADIEWRVMDESFQAMEIESYWVNVAQS
ncbi:MAG TPA: hypothetical protein ENF30_01770 [Candidatus Desulfofervidus auxilii]|uniref:Uncharacterized protein n=1 Tax=Desulfofervidus auxilii TaxID=1621989 RepID=A0A7V0IA43_DESA2|nr:hypothetical protein [Candidatus Desulfofervidus auxilii]